MNKIKSFLKNSSAFRICYVIDLLFCNFSFIQIPAYVLLFFLFIWGVTLIFYNQKRYKTFNKLRFGLWIAAFLLCSFITILINLTTAISALYSLIMLLHVCICFLIFYGMHTEQNTNVMSEMYTMCKLIMYITTIAGVVGLVCLMCGVSFQSDEFSWIYFIIFENRFTGVYVNPNLLGFISVVSIVCCHMLCKANFREKAGKPRVSRIWIVFCFGIDAFSLLLCDSNASLLLIICYIISYIIYILFTSASQMTKKQIALKILALCCAGVFVVCSSLMARVICQRGFSSMLATTTSQSGNIGPDADVGSEPVTFSHLNQNLDSGRFRLLKESIRLFKLSPIIGISNGNIVPYSDEYADSVMSYTYHNNDFHNGYVTILVSTGVIGFMLFSIFGVRFAKHIIQHLFSSKHIFSNDIFPCVFSFLLAYLVYALLEKALLYDISFMVVWFWLLMGVASTYLNRYEPMIESSYLFHKKRIRRHML